YPPENLGACVTVLPRRLQQARAMSQNPTDELVRPEAVSGAVLGGPSATDEVAYRPDLPRSPLALWCARHRWKVLVTALLLVVGSVGLLGTVGITTQDINDQLVGDSRAAQDIMDDADF